MAATRSSETATNDRSIDVLVIGGGPAGATAAALLAQQGRAVLLAERERFPRPHVGESLQPASLRLLDRHFPGMWDRFASAGFARKYGAVYVWGESREPWSVLFDARLEAALGELSEADLLASDHEHAFQVDRATFDQLLLDNARRQGVQVVEDTTVAVETDGDRVVSATLKGRAGTERVVPRVVIDCSGQHCVLGRKLGQPEAVPDLQSTASYGYYEGAGGVPGALGRHVQLVVTIPEGWAWFIPTSPTRTSIGIVHRRRARMSREDYEQAVREAGFPVQGASFDEDTGLRFSRDWSFSHRRTSGPNWLLAGDAACFVDPILSGGVDFAIRGAANAAVAVLDAGDGPLGAAAERYSKSLRREYQTYLNLARYWYGNNRSVDGFFWQAHEAIDALSGTTPLRAFVYLTTGHYAADRHLKVFAEWQEQRIFEALGVQPASAKKVLARKRQ